MDFASPLGEVVPVAVPAVPAEAQPPSNTFINDLFIPRHIIRVRIIPEAPTSAPAIINSLFPSTNPVVEPAIPE